MKTLSRISAILLACAVAPAWSQQQPSSPQELLRLVEQGRAAEAQEARQREARFRAERDQQQNLLAEARQRKAAMERRSDELETRFENNENRIAERQAQLTERLGSLRELFGVLQQVAGDTRAQFENSVTSAQYPGREEFLTDLAKKMGSTSKLATLEEIERLWFELQREMTASGEVARFTAEVTAANGEKGQRQVVRVGSFNIVSDGEYLRYVPETSNVVSLPRQPQQRYVDTTSELASASDGMVQFGIDPTRGSLLSLLIQSPSLKERIDQGGIVGYVILGLGALALLLALERLLVLSLESRKVSSQLKSKEAKDNNPLGRVLQALVTTVLGLCVAIPTVLLHTLVAGRSKKITHVLQERSAGLVAERMEQGGGS